VSDSYGLVAAAVLEVGRQPRAGTMDLLIAATAHAFVVRLYTRNAGDFTGIDELLDVAAVRPSYENLSTHASAPRRRQLRAVFLHGDILAALRFYSPVMCRSG